MTVSFDGRVARSGWALHVDRLDIDEGVTAVIGANGTGKTTLGRAVAGLDRLTDGRLEVAGSVADDPAAGVFVPAHRRRVAMVFQDLRLFGHLRVIDNVAFGLRRAGADRAGARRQAGALLERVGVDSAAWPRRPAALSGGQRQRVAIARALAPEPEVLIVDEPLASVDSSGRAQLRSLLGDSPARTCDPHHPRPGGRGHAGGAGGGARRRCRRQPGLAGGGDGLTRLRVGSHLPGRQRDPGPG